MPVPTLVSTVEKGAGETLAGNRVTDWSWVLCLAEFWKYQEVRSVLHRPLVNKFGEKEGRNRTWNHRTGSWHYGIF